MSESVDEEMGLFEWLKGLRRLKMETRIGNEAPMNTIINSSTHRSYCEFA